MSCEIVDEGYFIKHNDFRGLVNHVLENKYDMRLPSNTPIVPDKIYHITKNIFIETGKRSYGEIVPSGINQDNNNQYYVIGDFRRFFVFSIRTLRDLSRNRNEVSAKEGETTGYLLKFSDVLKYSDIDVKVNYNQRSLY